MEEIKPFEFKQCVSIIKFTGMKAESLRKLRDVIATVSHESIFHHTYQYFLKGHILEYTNDFAQWAGESLEESVLSEELSGIDPYEFKAISDLRGRLLETIDDYLKVSPEPREVLPGAEFYFNESVTLIFPLGVRAKNLAEFLTAIKYLDHGTIYFHFYEARIRLGEGVDDFSKWFEFALGKKGLADRIRSIDPFMHTIDGIKEHIIEAVDEEVRRDMEAEGRG